ncbi:MAG: ABC transporter ATP-binding protein [Verrucomicrobiae bacterium]|nr:ABC transporter ATP-binding protein [Verrucomicrobiae bacterium]
MIEISDLHKSYNGQAVLRGVNLHIKDGENLVVIGRSGGGKSVLLKHITGLIKPDSGKIVIDGTDMVPLNENQLVPFRRQMGLLFQSAALFDSMTVSENVGFPLKEQRNLSVTEIEEKVAEALEIVGLAGTQKKMPSELSGGMRKRVGLARAVICRPRYILYDEPTTGLDPVVADSINNLILQLGDRFDSTAIAVTHDMKSAYKIADRIAMLHDGHILMVGTPDELQASKDPIVRKFITGTADPQEIDF